MNPQSIGKQRNPAVVLLLIFLTFGIYFPIWYYKINREVKFHDTTQGFSPGLTLCACFIPIFNLVSFYNTANRVKIMQKVHGSTDLISPAAALLWLLFFSIGYPIYVQSAMNNHWHEHRTQVASTKAVLPAINEDVVSIPDQIEGGHEIPMEAALKEQ